MIIVRHILLALLLIGFISAPHVAGFFGVKPRSIENRPLATAPALTRAKLLDASYFQELSGYFRDNLPGRVEATLAYNWAILRGLRGSPASNVYEGQDGDLFLDVEFINPCARNITVEKLAQDVRNFAAGIEKTGRRVYVTFAPNKSYVYPEKMSGVLAKLAKCPDARRIEWRQRLKDSPGLRWIDLWAAVDKFEANSDELLFPKLGRHSTEMAGVVFAQSIVDAIRPGLWETDKIVERPATRTASELPMRFMGLNVAQYIKGFRVDRGLNAASSRRVEKLTPESRRESLFFRNQATNKPLIEAKTVVFHDSFMDLSMEPMAQYFADITFIHWAVFMDQPEVVAAKIAESEIVIVEHVEDLKDEAIPNAMGRAELVARITALIPQAVPKAAANPPTVPTAVPATAAPPG